MALHGLMLRGGRVFKMVSMLLYNLPSDRNYKVIFMKRGIREIMASQRIMLKRHGKDKSSVDDDEMGKLSEKHLNQLEKWLEKQRNIDILYISYNDIIKKLRENAEIVNQFMGGGLDIERMLAAIDKSLYRNKS